MNKLEQQLHRKFKELGVSPCIYHFVCDVYPYAAITIATTTKYWTWESLFEEVMRYVANSRFSDYGQTTKLKRKLEQAQLYPAICNSRDQFNRQRGRIISKGRLLKHLKEKT